MAALTTQPILDILAGWKDKPLAAQRQAIITALDMIMGIRGRSRYGLSRGLELGNAKINLNEVLKFLDRLILNQNRIAEYTRQYQQYNQQSDADSKRQADDMKKELVLERIGTADYAERMQHFFDLALKQIAFAGKDTGAAGKITGPVSMLKRCFESALRVLQNYGGRSAERQKLLDIIGVIKQQQESIVDEFPDLYRKTVVQNNLLNQLRYAAEFYGSDDPREAFTVVEVQQLRTKLRENIGYLDGFMQKIA